MRSNLKTVLALCLGVMLGGGIALTHSVMAEREPVSEELGIPLDELRQFTEVFSRVKSQYVEDVDDSELLENAIRGMLSGLDPHSAYLDERAFQDLQVGTSGEFGGLGIEVGMEDGFVRVIAPIDDTPAARAGIEAGDRIIRLDDESVQGMDLQEAVDKMRGEPGSEITLTIVREGRDAPFEVSIERDIIKVQSVRSRTLQPGYGYVRITQFQQRTAGDVVEAVEALREEAEEEALKGLILDLRNNPGGVLNGAVRVSDAFLDDGLIVYTEGRTDEDEHRFEARQGDVAEGIPMVVLINGGSASASEIVAGALQDHGRAIIMGSNSFGKGSVQTVLPMSNQTGLKLTTARYYTPAGRSIQAKGIEPDIPIERLEVAAQEDDGAAILSEADLSRHLDSEAERDMPEGPEGEPLAVEDYELHEALNLLRGLHILGKRQ